tara:strand:- start:1629 stop:2576 length:948 start_codon:yes stop_codon:yes gene_type:complete
MVVLLCGFFIQGHSANAKELVDRLIAEVNGDPIVQSEVDRKLSKGPLIQVSAFPEKESSSKKAIALADLINFNLIMQKADELNIEITDETLDQQIGAFLAQKNLSIEGLKPALRQQGISMQQYRKDFRNQLILNEFYRNIISPRIKITDKELEILYLQQSGSSAETIKLHLSQIQINIPSDAPHAIIKGKKDLSDEVYQRLKDGLPFKEAVNIYSTNQRSKDKAGKMPSLFLKDLAPSFRKEISNLQEEEFTRPIKAGNTFYIFKLDRKSFTGSDEFNTQKPALTNRLRAIEMQRQIQKWLEDQRRTSRIRVIEI